MSASKCGTTQPPARKPPLVSSSGPPGACVTPSSVMKLVNVSSAAMATVSFVDAFER